MQTGSVAALPQAPWATRPRRGQAPARGAPRSRVSACRAGPSAMLPRRLQQVTGRSALPFAGSRCGAILRPSCQRTLYRELWQGRAHRHTLAVFELGQRKGRPARHNARIPDVGRPRPLDGAFRAACRCGCLASTPPLHGPTLPCRSLRRSRPCRRAAARCWRAWWPKASSPPTRPPPAPPSSSSSSSASASGQSPPRSGCASWKVPA